MSFMMLNFTENVNSVYVNNVLQESTYIFYIYGMTPFIFKCIWHCFISELISRQFAQAFKEDVRYLQI
jgi:hypothetical protein